MKTELNISLIQFNPVWENPQANTEKLNEMFNDLPEDCDLVILPEMFTTGFSMSVNKSAESMHGAGVTWMCETAVTGKFAIIGSIMINDQGKFYNRSIFAYPDGTFKYYDKRHLFRFAGEDKYFTAGKQRMIADFLGWRICPLICYDLRFPVWSANGNNYDLLVYSSNWPEARRRAWEILPPARAVENQCFVAAVNATGYCNDTNYSGLSRIIDFKGNTIKTAGTETEIVSAKLDLDHLHKFRIKYDFTRDSDKYGIFY